MVSFPSAVFRPVRFCNIVEDRAEGPIELSNVIRKAAIKTRDQYGHFTIQQLGRLVDTEFFETHGKTMLRSRGRFHIGTSQIMCRRHAPPSCPAVTCRLQ